MDAPDVERGALLALVGGVVLAPYGLTKGRIVDALLVTGTHLPGLSPRATAQLFHVGETVPFLLLAAGCYALVRRSRPALTPAGGFGALVAAAGFVMIQVFHVGEHLLKPGEGPLPVALVASLEWGYYVGWLVLVVGLALLGIGLRRSDALPRWVPWALVGHLPAGVGVGLAVVALGLFTYAGSQRILPGLTWTAIGFRFRTGHVGHEERSRPAVR